jgi:putative methanogen marker protein 4
MNILEKFVIRGKNQRKNIGIGLGKSNIQNIKILNASRIFLKNNSSTIYLFGEKSSINQVSHHNIYLELEDKFTLINSINPEVEIFKYLSESKIDAAIRGSLSSSPFLSKIKEQFTFIEINRLALLETFKEQQFFFGPVGIDECNDYKSKISFIEKAIIELKSLDLVPKISILSGGRISDIGRDTFVDESIKMATKVVDYLKMNNPDLSIQHDEILIENAVSNDSNLIIAPNGVSGNLIYRTLVHLGEGKAYGAIYMDINKAVIDTSSVGDISEISGALILALALT